MSLHITEISYKLSAYEIHLEKNIINNISKFYTSMKENEDFIEKNIEKFKAKASSSINKTVYDINSSNSTSYYNQPSADIIKFTLLK